MLTESKKLIGIENTGNDKGVFLIIENIIEKDGVAVSKVKHRQPFYPGDIGKVIECLGADAPEVAYLNLIWTDQVIEDYRATQD